MHGRGHAWQAGVCMTGGGMHGKRGVHGRVACAEEGGACMAGETATAAGGTHTTGMHSCLTKVIIYSGNHTIKIMASKSTEVWYVVSVMAMSWF